ncbi:uncharacterized protein LOC143429305 [Xylocopa sonorina]|uniref:uncharacterized protein LOC143429305 n=1 Tax=Xylocopa sonorina TaxID=1818115 RepID=UPI00403B2604
MTTAVIKVRGRTGTLLDCRTLLDTCSTANFITEALATKLNLQRKRCSVPVGALNSLHTTCNHYTTTTIQSKHSNIRKTLTFYIIKTISTLIPSQSINREHIPIPANIKLADPNFDKPAPVQMLIGAGPTLSFLSVGQIQLSTTQNTDLILQKTQLGWIIGGSILEHGNKAKPASQTYHSAELQFDLERFWKIEEGATQTHLSLDEAAAENHFKQHIQRLENGRYVVALPFKDNHNQLGDSRQTAMKRLHSLESKLKRDTSLREEYTAVIQEYLDLGHLSPATDDQPGYYLPHHAVIKESSQTTKVRVVFDGSAKTSSGLSLNDTLLIGPTIQDDLFSLILRFRLYKYVLTGDIEKMYRQFLVREEDRRFQKILWRNSSGNIQPYHLNTVTFGLSAAPYLATRCIHQLADDEAEQYPLAANILKQDLYVDDLITGTQTRNQAIQLRDQVIGLLKQGGINIRQWASNDRTLLEGLPEAAIRLPLQSEQEATIKTLGIYWNSQTDTINYSVSPASIGNHISKRSILSDIAKIFDPLGLLGPVVVKAKILLQQLWLLKLHWDESVPSTIHTAWQEYRTQLSQLNNIAFPRKTTLDEADDIQLHGFCDASEKAFGACIYLRTFKRGQVQCTLLCSRTRVAPLKVISLPRLELCAALTLARLYHSVQQATNIKPTRTIFWSDSTITLHWIHTQPSLLKIFVANQVSEIQDKTNTAEWRHIPSEHNPADLLSRGVSPGDFTHLTSWYSGPTWLTLDENQWPNSPLSEPETLPEVKRQVCLTTKLQSNEIWDRYSCFAKLTRVIAYCLRFRRTHNHSSDLLPEELAAAHNRILYLVQAECFPSEMQDLKEGRVRPESKLNALSPFLDPDGLIRVGGRLKNSNLTYDRKHPIILPQSHHITSLIIEQAHIRNLHSGILSTLHNIRQRYWPLDGRNQVRKIVRRCVRCYRLCPPHSNIRMGDLPAARVTETRPFNVVGVDYCGPFFIKEKKYRNRNSVKVYVAVFVCLAVKAVHLEVVTDMTTDTFIAALRRFIARRGKCSQIYSDNGTNFIGANNQLKELFELLQSDVHQAKVNAMTAQEGIAWSFIPPRSPNFGGLWEAAVKSMKHHLRRVVGETLFTLEEFSTFVVQIEAVLNSRPLTPLSSDPNDLSALTPGHFLIGQPLTDLPDTNFSNTPANRLSRWQLIQKVRRDFWVRWHKEYLNGFHTRTKWTRDDQKLQNGMLVVIREDNLPPLQWRLGRIIQIHPGRDGIVRTVTVKTSTTTIVRNARSLAPLPLD